MKHPYGEDYADALDGFNPLRSAEDIETTERKAVKNVRKGFNPLRSAEDIETYTFIALGDRGGRASTRFDPQRILKLPTTSAKYPKA